MLVEWTLKKGINGLENLALIPGMTGSAPLKVGFYLFPFFCCVNLMHLLLLSMLVYSNKVSDNSTNKTVNTNTAHSAD
ncbi:hypothetical protein NVIRPANT_00610 [Pantoea sp. Nvir]|nr:hypothetical protein NVIRPANT_00610 [Pantoea sp. Nvir]